ncbi:unnamed protein product [Adineta steineri]|uniref:LITAF domain-containing protein n=1 Tax=Adineta steineri TaxID=433720 RepID=A0A816BJ71_9BILA|nr:unnamed protein product [Adineta steineri]CAF1609878.1 unnamed protein product [Adineta steineri]
MNSVYPNEEKQGFPPTYEQAMTYPQAPPIPSEFDMPTSPVVFQPQQPPVGMYSTQYMNPGPQAPPVGFYPSIGMYPTSATGQIHQGPQLGTSMFITTQSLIYGDLPIQCICPHCQQSIVTRIERQTGLVSWLVCGGILLLGGWFGCCLIPFCIDSLKDTEHYCPNCAVLLGTRRRM